MDIPVIVNHFQGLKINQGFSTVELVTVIIIVGILAATSTTLLLPARTMQLQAARDQIVAAVDVARQRAMSRRNAVRVVIAANQLDIQDDIDGDDDFSPSASVNIDGLAYPIALAPNQNITSATFVFNRLGETNGATLALTQGGASAQIVVTDSGYVY